MSDKTRNLLLGFVAGIIIIASATAEDWFGRFDYSAEAPGYLDSYLAIDRGDWMLALTPQWSIGYPLILSATRWMFSTGPEGDWIAIHVVNLVIFLATYLGFLYFLQVASIYTARVNGVESVAPADGWNIYLFSIGTSIFLLWQLIIGDVSRVSPDLSISCVFFLVTATCLNFLMRPSAKTAAIMGLLMGLGYVLKVGFLPASFLTLFIVWLQGWIRSPGDRLIMTSKLACALPVMAFLAVPYAAALSKAYGAFTLGESGSINYAWSVNHMPELCNWQGGPAPFGTPIHPTNLVWKNPPVFTFADPFPVTYPPYYNISYFYDGYHHFFSIRNEIAVLKENLSVFRRFFTGGDHAMIQGLAEVILLAGALFLLKERLVWWRRLTALWPLYLLTVCPICIYLLVHIEPRYVIGPLIALLVIPFLPLFIPTALISNRAGCALAIFLAIGCAGITVVDELKVLGRIYSHQTNVDDPAWKTGIYLQQQGIQPGDKVAAVGTGSCLWDTWAYVCGAHIVGEVGNFAYDPNDQDKDLQLFIRSPEVQQTVFKLFRQAGAVVVVARYLPEPPHGDGWVLVPGTAFWVHRL